jgi:ATP-dependent RNA helicase RhlE
VSHVFNFEMPNVAEQYVHRIGRTARAGADGVAVSFVAPDEKAYLRDIERLTGVKLMPQPLPEDFAKEAARLPLPSRKPAEMAQDARREERDARGRGGQPRGQVARRGGPGGNANRSPGGQARDGRSRDAHLRIDRAAAPRGSSYNPLGVEAGDRPARAEAPRREWQPRAEGQPRGDERRGDRRDGRSQDRQSTEGRVQRHPRPAGQPQRQGEPRAAGGRPAVRDMREGQNRSAKGRNRRG